MPSPKATKAAEQYMRELREQFEGLPPETMAEMAKAYRQKVKGQLGGVPLTPPEIENNHQLLEQEVAEAEAAGLFDEEGETVSEEKGEARDVEEQPQPSDEAGESGNDEEDEEENVEEERKRISRRRMLGGLLGLGAAAAVGGGIYLAKGVKLKEGPPGSKLFEEYEKLPLKEREMFLLKQIVEGNTPKACKEFIPIKATSTKGTTVEFEAAKWPLALGNNEDSFKVTMGGPHFVAAAELTGNALVTKWMAMMILDQAAKEDRLVRFYIQQDICWLLGMGTKTEPQLNALKQHPDMIRGGQKLIDEWIKGKEMIAQSNNVTWRDRQPMNPDGLLAGHYKNVTLPSADNTNILHIYGAVTGPALEKHLKKPDQPIGTLQSGRLGTGSSLHDIYYWDYSHGGRLWKPDSLKLNGKSMTLEEFMKSEESKEFRAEFHAQKTGVYKYTPELEAFVDKHK